MLSRTDYGRAIVEKAIQIGSRGKSITPSFSQTMITSMSKQISERARLCVIDQKANDLSENTSEGEKGEKMLLVRTSDMTKRRGSKRRVSIVMITLIWDVQDQYLCALRQSIFFHELSRS